MLCPRCRIPAFGEECPNCGRSLVPNKKKAEPEAADKGTIPIRFDVLTSTRREDPDEALDWRFELKRRLDQHTARKQDPFLDPPSEAERDSSPEEDATPPEQEDERTSVEDLPEGEGAGSVFDYQLREDNKPTLKNPVKPEADYRSRPTHQVFERPLIRVAPSDSEEREKAEKPVRKRPDLEPMLPMMFEADKVNVLPKEEIPEEEAADEERQIDLEDFSREILFSRFLSGIIDLTLPVLLALGLTFVASWILNFDIFMSETVVWVGAIALALHLFTSLFFFTTSGQTIGMYFTELELAGEEAHSGKPLSVYSILLRVLLFLPVAATVIGLLWALFDDRCRCVHDLVSGTRVVKLEEEMEYLRSRAPLRP